MRMVDLHSVCRLAYTLWGDSDYVQPGLLSHSERARLDGVQLPYVLAEVAATSTTHRDAAAGVQVVNTGVFPVFRGIRGACESDRGQSMCGCSIPVQRRLLGFGMI